MAEHVQGRFGGFRYATMLLLDDGCYANMYTNITVALPGGLALVLAS